MQQINGYSAIKAGLAFLPMTVLIGLGAAFAAKNLARYGPRPLLMTGMTLASTGMVTLGLRLQPDSSYLTVIIPSLVLIAIGMGLSFVSVTAAAVAGVPPEDAGIASALLNAGQQVGGAVGLAILTAVSTGRTSSIFPGVAQAQQQLRQARPPLSPELLALAKRTADATVSGWSTGFVVAGCILASAGLVFSTIKVDKTVAASALKDSVPA